MIGVRVGAMMAVGVSILPGVSGMFISWVIPIAWFPCKEERHKICNSSFSRKMWNYQFSFKGLNRKYFMLWIRLKLLISQTKCLSPHLATSSSFWNEHSKNRSYYSFYFSFENSTVTELTPFLQRKSTRGILGTSEQFQFQVSNIPTNRTLFCCYW